MDIDEILLTENLDIKAWVGDNLFQCLRNHLETKTIQKAYDLVLAKAEESLTEMTRYKQQWKSAARLTGCALLSTYEGDDAQKVCQAVVGELIRLGAVGPEQILANPKDVIIQDSLRRALERLFWPEPLNPAWAWDAICQFRSNLRRNCQEEILILLFEDSGILAKLELEAFPGAQVGLTIFPDPRAMAFVMIDESFIKSFATAGEYARLLAQTNRCPPVEVRWRVRMVDHGPLVGLKEPSAGAGFAMCLAKLLTKFASLEAQY